MGELYDAPNQQVVRPDGSGPWEEGSGASTPAETQPQAQAQAQPQVQGQREQQPSPQPEQQGEPVSAKPSVRRKTSDSEGR